MLTSHAQFRTAYIEFSHVLEPTIYEPRDLTLRTGLLPVSAKAPR
ncbi:hypothetical protein [Sinorhizobium americanum]|uniref:Uncharacterized protein n=1 Tax=Sinorhizobium americanum TaxID=194963 RepID=A0A4R2C0Z4_9HYPH|nr:hypothetical protein [Sinorhizobium americanum]TCN33756.1 hypothetical protein EV184_10262 [Sinorhizobium americanum]